MVPDALFLGLGARTSSDTPSVAIIAAGPSSAPVVSQNYCRTLPGLGGLLPPLPARSWGLCPLLLALPCVLWRWPPKGGGCHCCWCSRGWPLPRTVGLCPALGRCPGSRVGAAVGLSPARGVLCLLWGCRPWCQCCLHPLPPPHAAAPRGRSTSLALFALGPGSGRSDVDQAHERCPPPPPHSHQTLPGTLLTPWAHRTEGMARTLSPPASLCQDETPLLPNRGAQHGVEGRRMKGKTQFCALKRKLGLLFPWKRGCESKARGGCCAQSPQ